MKPNNKESCEKKEQVRQMFDNIAPTYDRLNHILSFNSDVRWRKRLLKMVRRVDPSSILDIATGTGDMAILYAENLPKTKINGIDISEQMIAVANQKIADKGISGRVELVVGDAEDLPYGDRIFDCVSIVFGVRNFCNIPLVLKEIHRVMRPEGTLFIMEFSMPQGNIFGVLYRFYSRRVLPLIGRIVSRDKIAYQYLPDSIPEFAALDFEKIVLEAGFKECKQTKLTHGVATIYSISN